MGSLPKSRRFDDVKNVCIVGAGASGLAAAKYLLAERAFSRIVVFEQRSCVGGLWNYVPCDDEALKALSIPQTNPHTGLDKPIRRPSNLLTDSSEHTGEELNFLTPMYDRLETNIPRGLMGFSDQDWPQTCQLFPKHEEVLEYIDQYSTEVQHLIRFKTQVVDIRQTETGKWAVETREIQRPNTPSESSNDDFDAVVVANGHFDVPYVPAVSGIEAWSQKYPGRISHAKLYRKPEQYTGRKVIVVGQLASGMDIGHQVSAFCTPPVLLSQKAGYDNNSNNESAPAQVRKPPIVEYILDNRSVRFADGSVESEIDSVIYCTGYLYSFPFLNTLSPPVVTTGERVEQTYQHVFYRPNPTLSFLVLNQRVVPFPIAEAQSSVIARVLSGRLSVPDEKEMKKWEEKTISAVGEGKLFHLLKFPMDADYINMLHDWAMSAGPGSDTPSSKGPNGKIPPYWDEKAYWARQRFPSIKGAFAECGERRHEIRTLEDLGFDYKEWKRGQTQESGG